MATRADEFETLYADHRLRLARRTVSLAGDRAEDVVHDAFLTYLSRGEEIGSPRAWLDKVARNRALNDLRRAREVPLANDVAAEQEQAPVERDAIRAVVAEALGELDQRSRRALQLRFFDELPYEEIARDLGVRVAQAHVILHRSLRRLGRAIVRRLATAHGVPDCAPALEQIAGFGSAANGHGPSACDRCRPVLDELAALRSLGLLPPGIGAMLLRRVGTETLARGPSLADLAGQVANAVVALGIAATSVLAPQISVSSGAVAENTKRAPASVVEPAQVGGVPVTRAPAAGGGGRIRRVDEGPKAIVDEGPVGVRADERHVQGEVKDEEGGPVGGAVVCEPLQPCPPPPSPGP